MYKDETGAKGVPSLVGSDISLVPCHNPYSFSALSHHEHVDDGADTIKALLSAKGIHAKKTKNTPDSHTKDLMAEFSLPLGKITDDLIVEPVIG